MFRNPEVFEKNMKILKIKYPVIAERVENAKEELFELVKSKDGQFYNIHSKEGQFYYYSDENPRTDCRRNIMDLKLKNARLAFFLGFGLGYELFEYLETEAKRQRTVYYLIVEKNPLFFKYAMHLYDMSSLLEDDKFYFVVGEEKDRLFVHIKNFISLKSVIALIKAIKPIYHLSSLGLYKEYYLQTLTALKEAIVYLLESYGNCPNDSLVGIENMFHNLNEIVLNPGIILLKDKFKGKPAIVMGSGPSLQAAIPFLQDLSEKAVLISAESTLRALVHHGLKPHMVASLERTIVTKNSFEGFDEETVKDVYLAGCPVIPKEAYEVYKGPRIIVYRNFAHFEWLEMDKGMLEIKQSSGNMAFKIADYLGCDPILLIGQDLCFSEDGITTHIEGAQGGYQQEQYQAAQMIQVKGNNREYVKTTSIWYEFLKAYEIDVADSKARVINCSEGGASIVGTTFIPFEDAVRKFILEDFHPLKMMEDIFSSYDTGEIQKDYERTLGLIDRTIPELEAIINNCKEGFELYTDNEEFLLDIFNNQKEFTKDNVPKLNELNYQVNSIKLKTISSSSVFQLIMAHIVQSFWIKFEIDINELPEKYEDIRMANLDILLRQKKWFATIHDLTLIVLDLLKRSKTDLLDSCDKLSVGVTVK